MSGSALCKSGKLRVKDWIVFDAGALIEMFAQKGVPGSIINALILKSRDAIAYVGNNPRLQNGYFSIMPVVPALFTNFSSLVKMISVGGIKCLTDLNIFALQHAARICETPYYAIAVHAGESFKNRSPANAYCDCGASQREGFMNLQELISFVILADEDMIRNCDLVALKTWCDVGNGNWQPIALKFNDYKLTLAPIDPSQSNPRLRYPFMRHRLF
jgi:hypothetical protein